MRVVRCYKLNLQTLDIVHVFLPSTFGFSNRVYTVRQPNKTRIFGWWTLLSRSSSSKIPGDTKYGHKAFSVETGMIKGAQGVESNFVLTMNCQCL